ncbi:hypothetical protein BJ994_003548 [Arthrobacter pigmenti]|uniref:Uncharacterized protein n=1 Tax=Arthrobacter pigmenti TaxID=271432 RepID=A0A846RVG5_9MICC|nr:hypothetical protein [Arthrobacter pigmenti]NJC24472.1 hypothetical protein [Arthrobacter pigmenti]
MGDLIAAFDEYLCGIRGVCAGAWRNYAEYVDQFLVAVLPDGVVDPLEIRAPEVVAVCGRPLGPLPDQDGGVGGVGVALILSVLRTAGLREDRLEDTRPDGAVVTPALFGIWVLGLSSS